MNFCPPKPGIHRHQQHEVELLERVIEIVERRRGIEHQARLAAVFADELDGAVDVFARFGMERDVGGAGLREVRHDAIDRLHHEMHVDRRGDAVLAQRLAHQRADGEVRHVVVVHDVEVDDVGARGEHRIHFLAEPREVRGENRRRDPGLFWDGMGMAAEFTRRRAAFMNSYASMICCVRCLACSSMDSGRPLALSLSG